MNAGQRVRHSGHVTMRARDYWCSLGDYARKTRAKDELERLIAERGTILEVLHNGFKVQWDSGSVSSCLGYLVIAAEG
jgi:hypothetical protein